MAGGFGPLNWFDEFFSAEPGESASVRVGPLEGKDVAAGLPSLGLETGEAIDLGSAGLMSLRWRNSNLSLPSL